MNNVDSATQEKRSKSLDFSNDEVLINGNNFAQINYLNECITIYCWYHPEKENSKKQKHAELIICIRLDLPMSSINGAIRNVTPTKSKHINNSRHAVAMIVHLARWDISSGSITWRICDPDERNGRDFSFRSNLCFPPCNSYLNNLCI